MVSPAPCKWMRSQCPTRCKTTDRLVGSGTDVHGQKGVRDCLAKAKGLTELVFVSAYQEKRHATSAPEARRKGDHSKLTVSPISTWTRRDGDETGLADDIGVAHSANKDVSLLQDIS